MRDISRIRHGLYCFGLAVPTALRTGRLGLQAMLLLALGACASTGEPAFQATGTSFAEQVLSTAYSRIADYYLYSVDFGQLSIDGLKRIAQVDDSVRVERADGRLNVHWGATEHSFSLPASDANRDWAQLTSMVTGEILASSPTLAAADADELLQRIMDGVTSDLDTYSRYVGPRRASADQRTIQGYEGIGIGIEMEPTGARITEVQANGPAAGLGLRPGDLIVNINGRVTAGMTGDIASDAIRGPAGTTVELVVMTSGGSERILAVRRQQITPLTIAARTDQGILVVQTSRFANGTAQQIEAAITRAKREDGSRMIGMILDLRGNPGGLLDQAEAVVNLFLNQGRILTTRGRRQRTRSGNASGKDLLDGLPLVILVDGHSASAAEVVTAALQDHGRAVVVGSRTFGKGSVQTLLPLPNRGELRITSSHLFAPSGYTWNQQGIVPNICTSPAEGETAVTPSEPIRLPAGASLAWLRENALTDAEAMAQIRTICTWRAHDPNIDLKIAREAILEHTLYNRAVTAIKVEANSLQSEPEDNRVLTQRPASLPSRPRTRRIDPRRLIRGRRTWRSRQRF